MKKIFFILIGVIFSMMVSSCVSTEIQEIYDSDLGIFDGDERARYVVSATGMITTYSYNPGLITAFSLKSKNEVKRDCLKKACQKSTKQGYEYIVILSEDEHYSQGIDGDNYTYQILMVPANKEDLADYSIYQAFRNTLFYKAPEY